MRVLRQLWAEMRVWVRARRNRTDLLRWIVRRPTLMGAIATYESALLFTARVEPRLKVLASLKASGRIGCPF